MAENSLAVAIQSVFALLQGFAALIRSTLFPLFLPF
jgi:hypothetical protein